MSEFPLRRGAYEIDSDKSRLDLDAIQSFLSTTYWAKGISREILTRAIAGADCYGIYWREADAPSGQGAAQVGFARLITDRVTFGYFSDVFVLPEHRGQGLAFWMVEAILANPAYADFRRWMLRTRDARALYERLGFEPGDVDKVMQKLGGAAYGR